MSEHLITIRTNDQVHLVERIFHENEFHHLPVVSSNQVLEGIISREDWLRVIHFLSMQQHREGKRFEMDELKASDIMTRYPLSIEPDDSIGLAADIFLSNKFHALPIVEDGKLVGIVTTHDLLRYSFASPIEQHS